jgi:hypothetical protein
MNENYMNYYTLYLIDASQGNIEIKISNESLGQGLFYEFLRTDHSANTVTLSAKPDYTINGQTNLTLDVNQYAKLINNGNDWIAPRFTNT